ncbi:UNVERIFIED_CONTAM: Pentatricopeptide repeat-containing protein, chloroplastic [Sesamum calycinum]|uniref:Pentatricopeptide repeat-containing protein, chloroplastic n=1 Tax=Sesamum calycinum TaxID=2727403 RepID=A0AAW2SSK5_9LAMI
MNGIIIRTLKHQKLLCVCRKYTSSAALLEGAAVEYGENQGKLEALQLVSNPANLRGLTFVESKAAHALLLRCSVIYSDIYAANNLLDAYSECSRMDYAFKLFEEIPLRNVVTWNLMILGCNKNFLFDDAWRVYCRMHNMGLGMDEFTYGSVLSACGALEHITSGKQVYGFVLKNGFFTNGYVRAGMIDLFARSCRVEDALMVLYDVHCENVVCWNAVVSGAVKNKDNWVALGIFSQMFRQSSLIPNAFTFSSVLTACAAVEELELGKSIHGQVIKGGAGADVFVGTAIVELYAKSGAMCDAIKQFRLMPVRNVVSWTSIISGFVQKGDSASALGVLKDMRKAGDEINTFTVSSVLAACANPSMFKDALQVHCWIFKIGLYLDPVVKASLINTYSKVGAIDLSEIAFAEAQDLKQVGRQVHGYALKVGMVSEVSVGSSIFTMYSKCGDLEESLKAFEQLERKDNISWTSMIAGLAEHGCADKAVQMFRQMEFENSVPDEKILATILNSCSALHSLRLGREIHGFALRCGFAEHTIIDDALVNMYSKCGDLNSAKMVFHAMPFKDQVSWSSLISGFAQRGYIEEVLQLFHDMLLSGITVDAFTISSVLGALAILSTPGICTLLHAYIIKKGIESEASIGSSLIMMYSKCGSIGDCKIRIEPDDVTFVGVLSACSHTGLVGEGYFHLNSMIRDYGIEPGYKHYTCMVDLLGRAGRLEEAHRFIVNMPIEPNTLVWETLLAACKVHGNHELGKLAAEKIKELQPSGAGAYVSVSNIWAEAGEWEHVLKIRGSMKETGIFEVFGPVELVQLPTDPETGGHCEGFGFVHVSSVIDHVGVQDSGAKTADFDDDDGGGLALNA